MRKIITAEAPIGLFDSGVGGLTILKALQQVLPSENIIYFGDTAHVPYGNKSKNAVTKYSTEIVKFLENKKVKFIIIGCNTASALALPSIKKIAKVDLLGVLMPAAKEAVKTTKNGKIAVIATQATVNSNSYKNTILKLNKNLKVYQFACPLLVPLIEDKKLLKTLLPKTLEHYLAPVKKCGADTLILGCTHYPIIKNQIAKMLGAGVKLIDSAHNTALETKNILAQKNLLNTYTKKGKIKAYTSDAPKHFEVLAKAILNQKSIKASLAK